MSGRERTGPRHDPETVLREWLARQDIAAVITQTHASVVAIAADRVFKMKKPVRYPFLDLSTAALRRRVCQRELELNRRLAPDVYVGLVDITDESGAVIDAAVQMVRLPDTDRLDTLLAGGRAEACVDKVARRMAAFHATATRSPQIDEVGTPARIRALWRAELDGLAPFAGSGVPARTAAEAERLAARFGTGRTPLFAARVAAGRICDGHGDLRADDVFCSPDGLRIIDCLEFDDRLRWGDVLADVAFLAMDLEWLGRSDLAVRFLTGYRRAAGDDWPATLAHHWLGYRAHVRAKVACLRLAAGDEAAARHATGHLDQSVRHLRAAQVRLVIVGGLPGTGKTTLARALADQDPELVVLRSDVLRRELFPFRSATDPREAREVGAGRYAREAVDRVYDAMLRRAAEHLAMGEPVILDASWADEGHRIAARALADRASAALVELCCEAPAQVAAQRLVQRADESRDESEADVAVAVAMARTFAPWPQALRVDTSGDVTSASRRAAAAFRAAADPRRDDPAG